ncbi:hypothetical protein EYF80_042317 [Liparis tanakae]|uniref:Uncharacterized protein n=1 Tax=Liparis tanakae TaxID=230148 RepID=A0A4Z2G383_9TELE|nr:hypothetical protein EYF80_042317 [Liparis tanakae]
MVNKFHEKTKSNRESVRLPVLPDVSALPVARAPGLSLYGVLHVASDKGNHESNGSLKYNSQLREHESLRPQTAKR